MQLKTVKLSDLTPYENNPRINDGAVKYVKESINQVGYITPIIVDENMVILAGHTRLKALQQQGEKTAEVIVREGLTDEQKKKYRLLDNKVGEFAEWDLDKLAEELDGLDFSGFDFGFLDDKEETEGGRYADGVKGSIAERYIVAPFSVLNVQNPEWQKRKKEWLEIIDSGEGRSDELLGSGLNSLIEEMSANLTGTSIFDPVLCETLIAWFCPKGGRIIDPFAGGSVRGLVSSFTGHEYIGVDLSAQQIEANENGYERIKEMRDFYGNALMHPTWINADSSTIDEIVEGEFDFMIACPPYADLEKYSDDPKDLSNMEYSDFIVAYSDIIKKTTDKLRDDAYAVIVVGEVRDKKGYYYNFVPDTIKAFEDAGLKYYNEIILNTPVGTGALRINKTFGTLRKVVKTHQNVLVFLKGNERNIELQEYDYEFGDGE